jgi:hypothetical protein
MNHDHDPHPDTLHADYPLPWNDIPSPRRSYVGAPHESSGYQGGRADYGRGSAQEPPWVDLPRHGQRYREVWENAPWSEPWPQETGATPTAPYDWPDGGGRGLHAGEPGGAREYRRRDGGGRSAQGRHANANHAGKGPRGYRRSDERICDELCERLTEHPQIDASEIEIGVEEGVVSLRGTVPDRQMKHRTEDCAERINGVKDVDNRLRVQRESVDGESDDDESSLLV